MNYINKIAKYGNLAKVIKDNLILNDIIYTEIYLLIFIQHCAKISEFSKSQN
jgi:hypothetical protein